MSVRNQMTPDELRNNYEFKVVRRAIMKEFPYILDVGFIDDEINTYNIIFLEFVVDPIKMGEFYGWEINPWIQGIIGRDQRYRATYPSLIFNTSYNQARDEVNEPIMDLIEGIHKSPALPDDLRLPQGRTFNIGAFIVNPDGHEW
jgi:hypothetical protein